MPTELPEFAAESTNIIEPAPSQKAEGWRLGQAPPSGQMNWLHKRSYAALLSESTMINTRITALAMLALTACAPGNPFRWRPDPLPDYPPCSLHTNPASQAHADELRGFCDVVERYRDDLGRNPVLLIVAPQEQLDEADARHYFGEPCGSGCRTGYYRKSQGVHQLIFTDAVSGESLWDGMLHELCHARGMAHVPGEPFGRPEECGD